MFFFRKKKKKKPSPTALSLRQHNTAIRLDEHFTRETALYERVQGEKSVKTWFNKTLSFILHDTGSTGLTVWKDTTTLDVRVLYCIQRC